LSDVSLEELMAWLAVLDERPSLAQEHLIKAIEEVPVVERLLLIHENARNNDAPLEMLQRNRDIMNTLIAIFHIERGTPVPEHDG